MEIIESIRDLDEIKHRFQEQRKLSLLNGDFKQEYYRGLGRENYDLKSYLSRFSKDAKDLKEIEISSLEEFKKQITKLDPKFLREHPLNYKYYKEWEIMWQAQQAGLPTRLMDWSLSIETACFFACMQIKNDDSNGQLYVFTCPSNICYPLDTNKYLDENPTEFQSKFLINPDFNDGNDFQKQLAELRRLRQDGKFLFQNYGESHLSLEKQTSLKRDLHKFVIPKDSKQKLREELAKKGYTENTILPKASPEIDGLINKIIKEKIQRTTLHSRP